jgi:hypothetical protein
MPPLTVVQIRAQVMTESGCLPNINSACIDNVTIPDIHALTGGPALIQTNKLGQAYI